MHLEKGGPPTTVDIARPEDVAVAAGLSPCVTHVEADGNGKLAVTNNPYGLVRHWQNINDEQILKPQQARTVVRQRNRLFSRQRQG